jgi:C_GCAxxG_C_C family probable redox protein
MSRIADAISRFCEGSNCSHAILSVYAPQFGLDEQTATRIATSFGSGMGTKAEMCGAVIGALLVLDQKYEAPSSDDHQSKETACERLRDFADRFKHAMVRSCAETCRVWISHRPRIVSLPEKRCSFRRAAPSSCGMIAKSWRNFSATVAQAILQNAVAESRLPRSA